MPRRNRNPGAGKPSHNGPARRGGRSGSGIYGAEKGARVLRPLGGKDDEYAERIRARARDAGVMAAKEEMAEAMRHVLLETALSGDGDAVRVHAADKLLDRLEGKPVQKSELKLRTMNPDDMTDEELAAIAAGGRAAAAGEADA